MMWFFPVLTLLVATSVRSETIDYSLPTLPTPRDLVVGNASDTSVVVSWNYPEMRNPPLRRVEFVLLLKSELHSSRTYNICSESRPLKFMLGDLSPNTSYSVSLSAISLSWRHSSIAWANFTTQREDWPTPLITDFSQILRDDLAEYFVEWSIGTQVPELSHFEIEVCSDSCSITRRNSSEYSTRVNIDYFKFFNLRVIANYELPVVGKVKRYSKPIQRYSGAGLPSRILLPVEAVNTSDRIKLRWHPSFGPNGPSTYYEFFVSDPTRKSGILEPFRKLVYQHVKSRMQLRLYAEIDGVYDLRLDARGLLAGDDPIFQFLPFPIHFWKEKTASVEEHRETDPLLLYALEGTSSTARFRVLFRKSHLNETFKTETWKKSLQIGPGVAKRFGLSANTLLKYKIRSCLTYEGKSLDVCGNFTEIEYLSNVGAPSRVRNLNFYFKSFDIAVITWDEPAIPRGPIDGYDVIIKKIYDDVPYIEEIKLNSDERSYVMHDFHPQRNIKVRVAAFNLDPRNNNTKLLGDWESVYTETGIPPSRMLWIMLLIILLIFITLEYYAELNGGWFEGNHLH